MRSLPGAHLLVEPLMAGHHASCHKGAAHDQQQVGHYGAQQRELHYAQIALPQGYRRDDDLGGVAKGCVEQAAEGVVCVHG
jgi:hypothetical protein